jgi:hypothetical protein
MKENGQNLQRQSRWRKTVWAYWNLFFLMLPSICRVSLRRLIFGPLVETWDWRMELFIDVIQSKRNDVATPEEIRTNLEKISAPIAKVIIDSI